MAKTQFYRLAPCFCSLCTIVRVDLLVLPRVTIILFLGEVRCHPSLFLSFTLRFCYNPGCYQSFLVISHSFWSVLLLKSGDDLITTLL